jgi:hypothetical protein
MTFAKCLALTCLISTVLMSSCLEPALAHSNGPTLEDRQQAACFQDAQKLCGNYIPNVDQVTACMSDKRPLVSPKCAEMYDAKQ